MRGKIGGVYCVLVVLAVAFLGCNNDLASLEETPRVEEESFYVDGVAFSQSGSHTSSPLDTQLYFAALPSKADPFPRGERCDCSRLSVVANDRESGTRLVVKRKITTNYVDYLGYSETHITVEQCTLIVTSAKKKKEWDSFLLGIIQEDQEKLTPRDIYPPTSLIA